jgi:hypothetical protein
METDHEKKQHYLRAKKKVRNIQLFYIHLAAYLLVVTFILINLYTIESEELKRTVTGVNVSSLILWAVFIALHGRRVFKGKILFKKSWEERKIHEILEENEEEETTLWE